MSHTAGVAQACHTVRPSPERIESAAKNTFRYDINALRAFSVVAVLGFHAKVPGFAGGFVGVDVFFLITGYLMTGIVLRDLEKQCFSFWSFALNRMRRIYPALAVVVIVSAVAGWFLTLPGEYIRHLRQASYALAALSNFAFDADNGYFASAAQTKPLLHTWSLAIEWQFYIGMPLAAALLWKLALLSTDRLKVMLVAFGALSLASFLWCLWQNYSDMMGSAFFSLRARAWEPLVGGMIALLELRRRPESPDASFTAAAMSAAGWAILVLCIAYPLPEREWPGALTLLPILGAAPIVLARWKIGGGLLWSHNRPIPRKLVLFDLSLALAHLGVLRDVASLARIRGDQRRKGVCGFGFNRNGCGVVLFGGTATSKTSRHLASQSPGTERHLCVSVVAVLHGDSLLSPWVSKKAARVSFSRRGSSEDGNAKRRVL